MQEILSLIESNIQMIFITSTCKYFREYIVDALNDHSHL